MKVFDEKALESLPMIERDISWLSFNYRVLLQAKDKSLPLYERIKFLAIYSSNLGEFFGVRVSQHRNLLRISKKEKKQLHINPETVLKEILHIVRTQQEEFNNIFEKDIIPELARNNIHLLRRTELNEDQKRFVNQYFKRFMLPFVQPVLLNKDKIRPFLNNSALYLSLQMREKKGKEDVQYGIVKIPSDHLPRFIELPSKDLSKNIIYLDDIVRQSISWMFPGYEIIDTYSIKLTRDAELYIDDEFSGDLIQKIKESLNKRDVGPASRLVYDYSMPDEMLKYLVDIFELENMDLIAEGRYHNNFDLFKLPNFGRRDLMYSKLEPLAYTALEESSNIFDEIGEEEHLLMYPYHSYESTIKFFEDAANDPTVTHIKITQYRVARESRIMNALISASEKGINVSVFVEVKARFDEEANLIWGERLQKAGVNVYYSFPGLKVHCKLAMVRRVIDGKVSKSCYLSTGNFHEDTAKLYSDFGFFTADRRLTSEVAKLFTIVETKHLPNVDFEHLLVGQFNLKEKLIELIQNEIANKKAGKKAEIFVKFNSLQDEEMIFWLYEASSAGVNIKIICRGICSLIPGKKGLSENIKVISIIDRYLEHARVFNFWADGQDLIYLSSADWMKRNLNYRIETAFPIYNQRHKDTIKYIMNVHWDDNTNAYEIHPKDNNRLNESGKEIKIQSQIETYYFFKRIHEYDKLEDDN